MNCKDYGFSIVILIFMITKESHTSYIRSKVFPDNDNISQTFSELLSSLATVNQERVDALKKFFKLENYETAKRILRIGDKKDLPPITLLVIDKDEDPIITQIPIYRSKKHKKYKYEDSDSDSSSSTDYSDTDDRRDFIDKNLRMHRVKVPPKREIHEVSEASSHEVVSSENKTITNEVLISSSSQEDVYPPKPASRYCSSSQRNYMNCVYSCKEAYRYSCSHFSYCSNRLYSLLRKECKYSCKKRFYY